MEEGRGETFEVGDDAGEVVGEAGVEAVEELVFISTLKFGERKWGGGGLRRKDLYTPPP